MLLNGSGSIESDVRILSECCWKGNESLADMQRPIMALIAGIQAPQDRVMGHAGAIVRSVEKTALQKVKALENAGAVITNHPSKVGGHMAQLLDVSECSQGGWL